MSSLGLDTVSNVVIRNRIEKTLDVSRHSTEALFIQILFAALGNIKIVRKDYSVRMKWARCRLH